MKVSAWQRIRVLMMLGAAVPSLVALILIWSAPGAIETSPALRWTLTTLVLLAWFGLAELVRERLVERLRTFGNLVGALRERDYSVRASGASRDDPLGEIALELNELTTELRDRRLVRREGEALLEKVLAETDAAIYAFDGETRLRLVNDAGARLLSRSRAELLGVSARALGLAGFLEGESPRVEALPLPGRTGRCELRRRPFRQEGELHQLLMLIDLSRALAAEERLAWKRLLQVLRHEINNSLAPIQSIGTTLRDKLGRDPRPEGWEQDVVEGLEVISSRAAALARLTTAYAELTRLPSPELRSVELGQLLERVVALERRAKIELVAGPELSLQADADQLEQALINLLTNATDAALETGGGVRARWSRAPDDPAFAEIVIEDEGPGLSDTENLFVPFFTTKPGGSGIGLVLSRQIVDAHGGRLQLGNRDDGRGCRVLLRLPLT